MGKWQLRRILKVGGWALTTAIWSMFILRAASDRTDRRAVEETDSPDLAFEWRRLAWRDESGSIPEDGLKKALAQRKANIAYWQGDPGVQSMPWVELGPKNVGGRTRSLLVHPTDPSILYAGSVGGGVWKSVDGGVNWTITNDWLKSIAIGSLAFEPGNPNVIYAGTGEGQFNGDAINGAGIYKSVDAGATWTLLGGTATWSTVNAISISPANPNLILASTRYGGIQRSTDAGATWTNPYWAQGSFDVDFSNSNANNVIAHVIEYDWNANDWFHAAMYSTDAGLTWTAAGGLNKVFGFSSRIAVQYAPNNNSIVFAVCGKSGGEVWKSTDGGHNYSFVSSGTVGTSWYTAPLWVDPTNSNVLVTGSYHLFRSINGGANWTQISDGYILTTQPHPDQHFVVHDPGYNGTSNRRVFNCNDGGVFVTNDIYTASTGAGWTSLNLGYTTSQFYAAVGNGPADRIIGGTQDNGTLRLQGGSTMANLPFGGDGGFCDIDATDPNYTYGEYVGLQIHRSTNGGVSANYIYSGIGDAGTDANFIAPFLLSPANPNVFFAGGRRLWRSMNVKAPTPAWTQVRAAGSDRISAIASSASNQDLVWVGQNDGGIAKSNNATSGSPTWTEINLPSGTPNPLPNRYVGRILIDPNNSNIVYVALGGFTPNNLWKTTDGGTTWSSITGSGVTGLPDVPMRGIVRHPTDANYLYVATEVGVFQSADGGATWSTNEFGPASVCTHDLQLIQGTSRILAATHGRGLWSLQLPDNPAPFLSSMTPNSTIAGHAALTVQVAGSGFITGSVVKWNGSNLVTRFVSSTQLEADVPASLLTTVGNATVSAFNPAPGGGTSNGLTFTVKANWDATVQTSPVSGVAVTVSPADAGGQSNGVTPFGRQYPDQTHVSLGFPAQLTGRMLYDHREVNGVSTTAPLIIDGDKAVTGVYVQGYQLTVQSAPTGTAMTVWTKDYYNRGDGTTPFTRIYKNGVTASLTAPAQLPGKWFDHWELDGVPVAGNSRTVSVAMAADHTLKAVYVNTFTVTVSSTNPVNGVPISVWTLDKNGQGNGTTLFTRLYTQGTQASFTAPGTVGNNYFMRWDRNGTPWLATKTVTLPVGANTTITAVYGIGSVLTVNSSPSAGVPITVWTTDKKGQKDGTTAFTRLYAPNQSVSLTAPATAGGKPFMNWKKDGVVQPGSSKTITVNMATAHTCSVTYGP